MKDSKRTLNIDTKLTQLGRDPDSQFGFVNAPVYRGSTVIFKTVDDLENNRSRFHYGTEGTPTISHLENAWSEIAGAAGTVLSPSGLGAVSLALLSTLKSGDHLLMTDSVYKPTRFFCNDFLKRFGVEVTYYDPMIGAGINELIKENTSTIFLEAPGSQSFEIQDVPAITAIAQSKGIKTIIDNTWATPLFFKAHEHGCDLSVEAGTKYLSGHSDLLMGMVSANAATWPALRKTYDNLAMLPGAEDCFLALRGLRTMHIRLKEVEQRGLVLASWLQEQPEVQKILHPAFEDCPGHDIWKRDFSGSTGLFSVVLDPKFDKKALANMLDNMTIFGMGYSWGGFESLVIPFDCSSYRTVTQWAPGGLTIRIQIGLENMEDLKFDLRDGLDRLSRTENN
ncbi:cystathionine beta-lyase [Gammaproteobacteria bacterium AS21]